MKTAVRANIWRDVHSRCRRHRRRCRRLCCRRQGGREEEQRNSLAESGKPRLRGCTKRGRPSAVLLPPHHGLRVSAQSVSSVPSKRATQKQDPFQAGGMEPFFNAPCAPSFLRYARASSDGRKTTELRPKHGARVLPLRTVVGFLTILHTVPSSAAPSDVQQSAGNSTHGPIQPFGAADRLWGRLSRWWP